MKKTPHQQPHIPLDPDAEAAEFENILRDVGKSIGESCERLGKSGLTYAQFKANFLKTLAKTATPPRVCH